MEMKDAFKTFNAAKSSEPSLKHFIVVTEWMKRIKTNPNVTVVSGLKGIGKTATFRELTEFDTVQDIIVELSSDSYSLSLPSSDLRSVTFSHEFEYEIVIDLLQKFVSATHLHQIVSSALVREAKSHISMFLEDLKELGGRITGISVLGCGFNLSDAQAKVLTGLRGRENEIKAINILQKLCDAGIKMRVVIDDPEDVFFSDNNLNPTIIGGLWLAACRLNNLSKNLKVFILMKTHVCDVAFENTPDLDKFPNSQLSICWKEDDLKEIIKRRVEFFTKTKSWEQTLFGTSSATKLKTIYKLIFSNLRNGPRELLSWIHFSIEQMELESKLYLSLELFEKTLPKLSRDSFKYFNSSNSEEFPEIGNLVKIIFEKHEEKVFTNNEFTNRIKQLQMQSEDFQALQRKHYWIQSTISNDFAERMFRVGAINLVGSTEIYPYMCNYNQDNFLSLNKFKLTPLFKHYLKGT